MSDIKKTALVILIIALLSNTFTQYAYAANDYNHSELLEYEGYGQAMYESIVEQTTFVTGQYTDNKEYVNDSMNQIKDYANFWSNERQMLEGACGGTALFTSSCLGTLAESAGGYALTVGDWIKNLFNDYDIAENQDSEELTGLESYFTYQSHGYMTVNEGFSASYNDGKNMLSFMRASLDGPRDWSPNWRVWFYGNNGSINGYYKDFPNKQEAQAYIDANNPKLNSVNGIIKHYMTAGVTIGIYRQVGVKFEKVDVTKPDISNTHIRNINNYLQENPVQTVLPKLQPHLVCPDGTRIQMAVNGSTFLAVDGTVMLVNKDGTAEVNGSLCNLGWTKPTVDYDPVTEKPVVTQPDGTETDLETGDSQIKPPGATDLEGCTGVLCGIGKLLDGIGSLVKAIGDLVKKLLDGLLGLFVPDDLGFVTEEFNKITKKLNDKIAITDSLKEAITSVFDGGGSNPLANISINLPITNEPLTFGNVSFIEEGVPILRRVISAIVVLYTIAYVYRKITGRGGVMER